MYSVGEGEFVDFYQITDEYELLVAETGIRSEKAYLLNKIGDVIWENRVALVLYRKR